MRSPLAQFDIIDIFNILNIKSVGLSLNISNMSMTLLLGLVLGFIIFSSGVIINKVIPCNGQMIREYIYMFIYRMVLEQIGQSGLVYFPFLFALFSFILIFNLLALMPFSFAVTSHIIWVLYFSTSICLGAFLIGIFKYKVNFLKLFVPKVPLILYPLMIIMEIVSYIIRSFSLGIRLSANIIAGHILVHIIASVIYSLSNAKNLIVVLPLLLLLAIFVLEVGIACLQAYIFTILICMYLNDSINLPSH